MSIVCLCGADASGKSTIIHHLKEQYPATYIREPSNPFIIDEIKICDNIYKKIRLFAQDRKLIYNELNTTTSTIISDRSFLCSMAYQSLEFPNEIPITALHYIYKCNQDVPHPNVVIYTTATPDVINRRLKARGEPTLSTKYIHDVQSRYQLVFKLLDINPIIIDTTYSSINDNVSKVLSILPALTT